MTQYSLKRLIGAGILLISLIVGMDSPAHAQSLLPGGNFLVSILADVYMMAGPGVDSGPVGKIPLGTAVPALARNASTTWILVEYQGLRGWVSTVYILSPDGDLIALPYPSPEMLVPNSAGKVLATAIIKMNIRGGPGRGFERLGLMPAGTSVILDGKSGRWIRYQFDAHFKGWLSLSLVRITGDLSSLPDVTFP